MKYNEHNNSIRNYIVHIKHNGVKTYRWVTARSADQAQELMLDAFAGNNIEILCVYPDTDGMVN